MEMTEDARPEEEPRETIPAPAWRSWLVVLIAAVLLLGGAVGIELVHRAEFVKSVGRVPRAWSDPQVRAFSRAQALFANGDRTAGSEAMLAVAEMRPSGDATAAAWWQWALFGVPFDDHAERAKCALKALDAAPDDNPRLAMYFHAYADEVLELGKTADAIAAAEETLARAALPRSRDAVVDDAVSSLTSAGHAEDAVRFYEALAKRYPDAIGSDRARMSYADGLAETGHTDEARSILTDIAGKASGVEKRRAEAALQKLSGGGAR
jgi:tetratricopeptide (TPR) repeat protein